MCWCQNVSAMSFVRQSPPKSPPTGVRNTRTSLQQSGLRGQSLRARKMGNLYPLLPLQVTIRVNKAVYLVQNITKNMFLLIFLATFLLVFLCMCYIKCEIPPKKVFRTLLPYCNIFSPPVDYVQCPHCQRRFNENAADRHIKFCQEQASRIANKSKAAVEVKKPAARTPVMATTFIHKNNSLNVSICTG